MRKSLLSIFLLFLTMPAMAEQAPKSAGLDSRVQYFDYNENDVFRIHTKIGTSSLIQLDKGEIIHDDGGLGMGESKNWSIAVKANNIFFKPTQVMADTNMIVVTNKRTYAFEMTTTEKDITYIARFKYPEEITTKEKSKETAKPISYKEIKDIKGNSILIDSRINTKYVKKGTLAISPTAVWDNNLFTFMQFDNANELPTVYKVMPDGSEQVVNTHVEKDTLILHEINDLYRLRLGQSVIDIKNLSKIKSTFNHTGTSQDGLERGEVK